MTTCPTLDRLRGRNHPLIMKSIFFLLGVALLNSCAVLHNIQVGEVESFNGYIHKPFEIKMSEVGFDAARTSDQMKALNRNQDNAASDALAIVALFQMGPRTGLPVYNRDFAKNLIQIIYEKCPSGRVTGLMSIREHRDYSIVSGEILKIKGLCLLPKGV